MVKLTGPIQSLAASGSIAKAITASSWKGRQYLKRRPVPEDPQSPAQIAQRAMVTFLSTVWSTLSHADQATWSEVAASTQVPPYNAFLGYNLDRLHTVRGPTKKYPAAEEGTVGTPAGAEPLCTNAVHSIHTNFWFSDQDDVWGYILMSRQEAGDPPDLTNLVYMGLAEADPHENIQIIQRPVGLWRQTVRMFSDDGLMGPMRNQINGRSLPYP